MTVRCGICDSNAISKKLQKNRFEILQCGDCGVAFWLPDAGFDSHSLYGADYFESAEADDGYSDYAGLEVALRASFARRIARIERPREGARLLDLGAAFGYAVDEARRAGWRAMGMDVAATALRQATAGASGRVTVASATALPLSPESVAAVTMWDVIEHLPDPHAALSEASRVLEPGGTLALTTGDIDSIVAKLSGSRWHLYNLPEHLYFFSERSLRLLLDRHGFRVTRSTREGAHFTLGYLVERISKTILGGYGPRSHSYPGAGIRIPFNLFDVMTIYAVRR